MFEHILKADPSPLYIQRKLINPDPFIEWAKSQGFPKVLSPDELHVTVVYSNQPVDWDSLAPAEDHISVTGGPRSVIPLGSEGAVVLKFHSQDLQERHSQWENAGASWDYEGYQCHVTISYFAAAVNLLSVKPYTGVLEFGPEIYEPINENYKETVVEKVDAAQSIASSPGFFSVFKGNPLVAKSDLSATDVAGAGLIEPQPKKRKHLSLAWLLHSNDEPVQKGAPYGNDNAAKDHVDKPPAKPPSPRLIKYRSDVASAKEHAATLSATVAEINSLSDADKGTAKERDLHRTAAHHADQAAARQFDAANGAAIMGRNDIKAVHDEHSNRLSRLLVHHSNKASELDELLNPKTPEPATTNVETAPKKQSPDQSEPKHDYKTPVSELTEYEKSESIRMYTQSGGTYQQVNSHLREGREADDRTNQTISVLEDAFKNDGVPMGKQVLHRGISGHNPGDLGLSVGTEFTDKGFVSTSGNLAEAKKFAAYDPSGKLQGELAEGTLFKITGGPDSKMLDLRSHSRYGEDEFLLPRGSKFKVTNVKHGEPGKTFSVVSLKVVPNGK